MTNKLSSTIFLSDHINKKGLSKLYLQIIIDRKTKRYPLEIFIEPDNWDRASSKVIKRDDKAILNRIITNELAKVNKYYLVMREAENVSFERFDELFLNISHTKLSDMFELHYKRISSDSAKPFKTVAKQLMFLFGDIEINKVNLKIINEYHDYIKDKAHNTIWVRHKCLKTVINTAIRHEIYKNKNPYNNFKINYIQTLRVFLEMKEVEAIEKILIRPHVAERIKHCARAFLFQCYTGLRYSDLKQLKFDQIQSNSIRLKTQKTEEIIYIPISSRAQSILNVMDRTKSYVFKIPTNQKYNDALKEVGIEAKIAKALTSHVARHTFATISIDLGIPIEIISKLLGHKKIKTTQIYAQIKNPVLDKYMQNWNK
ncbi:MAG: site-specific integrase [Bacteroidales bacterium]|nr:site-specific integrase [Bacteroidales bacterium]